MEDDLEKDERLFGFYEEDRLVEVYEDAEVDD